jgi:hypothetical protein
MGVSSRGFRRFPFFFFFNMVFMRGFIKQGKFDYPVNAKVSGCDTKLVKGGIQEKPFEMT